MSLEKIIKFEKKLAQMKNPRERRGFLQSFYSELKNKNIYDEDTAGIEKTADILKKYGLEDQAKNLLQHPAYTLRGYINLKYGDIPEQKQKEMIKVMTNYEDNKWWDSPDPKEAAKYQFYEDIMLIKPETYIEGLSQLLGRQVFKMELYSNREGLEKEMLNARPPEKSIESGMPKILVIEDDETARNYGHEMVNNYLNKKSSLKK